MPTLIKADQEVLDLMDEVIKAHHPDLDTHEVRITILMAHPDEDEQGEPVGPPLKIHGGYPCDAIISITPYQYRAIGCADALLKIDAARWENKDDDERKALLDHELYHLELAKKVSGELIKDKCNRPKLKMRLHDVEIGWFVAIAQRHGMASGEVQDAQKVFGGEMGQVFFPFANHALGNKPKKGEA